MSSPIIEKGNSVDEKINSIPILSQTMPCFTSYGIILIINFIRFIYSEAGYAQLNVLI